MKVYGDTAIDIINLGEADLIKLTLPPGIFSGQRIAHKSGLVFVITVIDTRFGGGFQLIGIRSPQIAGHTWVIPFYPHGVNTELIPVPQHTAIAYINSLS